MTPTMPPLTPDMTAELALVLVHILRQHAADGAFHDARRMGAGTAVIETGTKALTQMVRLGWAERRSRGARHITYRLTDEGQRQAGTAQAFLDAHRAAQALAWEAEHVVYGAARDPAVPLTPVQAKAWVEGYLVSLIQAAPIPIDAPPEAVAMFAEQHARVLRRMAPSNPFR